MMQDIQYDQENLDPCPNVHELFVLYNQLYFNDKLGACSVEWSSKRMTRCAGICSYTQGGGCIIRLSEPLLKFRSTKELKETLLHEMIHAYVFLQNIRDDGGHGAQFQNIMKKINNSNVDDPVRPAEGYHISIYHTFKDEVAFYQQHQWTCQRCGKIINRSTNRAPQQADCRWIKRGSEDCGDQLCGFHAHTRNCGGSFAKTKEPEKIQNKRRKKGTGQKLITNYLGNSSAENSGVQFDEVLFNDTEQQQSESGVGSSERTTKNSENKSNNDARSVREKCGEAAAKRYNAGKSEVVVNLTNDDIETKIQIKNNIQNESLCLQCPVCWKGFCSNLELNNHLDNCLMFKSG